MRFFDQRQAGTSKILWIATRESLESVRTVFWCSSLSDMRKSECRLCGKLFTYRSNKIFCSDICRAKSWRMPSTDPVEACYYCGVPADTIDHVPPRAARPAIIQTGLTSRYPFVEIPSCRECNCLLGARPLWLVKQRKKFVKGALKRRYS